MKGAIAGTQEKNTSKSGKIEWVYLISTGDRRDKEP